MNVASLVMGILSFLGMFIAFFPCLGSLNWINIPFAGIGFIISIIAMSKTPDNESKTSSIIGLVLCGIAIIFGLGRLILGGGVL